jgi:hypothetical protein
MGPQREPLPLLRGARGRNAGAGAAFEIVPDRRIERTARLFAKGRNPAQERFAFQ